MTKCINIIQIVRKCCARRFALAPIPAHKTSSIVEAWGAFVVAERHNSLVPQ